MGRYAAPGQVTTTAAKPMVVGGGDGNIDPEISLLIAGFSSTPDDKQFLFALYENTDMGTGGTAITPKKIGRGATSAFTIKKGTFTVDPTKTGVAMVTIPVYQRSRGVVQKSFGEGYRTESVAANRGMGLWCDISGGAINGEFTIEWFE